MKFSITSSLGRYGLIVYTILRILWGCLQNKSVAPSRGNILCKNQKLKYVNCMSGAFVMVCKCMYVCATLEYNTNIGYDMNLILLPK